MKKLFYYFTCTIFLLMMCLIVKAQNSNGNGDLDADGVLDKDDVCPGVAGPKSNGGCPLENLKSTAYVSTKSFGFVYSTNNKDSVAVEFLFERSSAINSGLKVGDLIISINGISILDKEKAEVRDIFNSLPDNDVNFVVKRKDVTKELKISKVDKSLMLNICLTGNCKDGYGNFQDSIGNKYEGEFKSGLRTRNGKMYYVNGGTYTGSWSANKRTGKGKFIMSNGNQYNGDWIDDKFNGNGEYIWADGQTYVGSWIDNKYSGKGKMVLLNKNTYDGQWVNGKKSGNGRYTWLNGNSYTGEFKNDKIDGKGIFIFASGDKYDGNFTDEKKNGKGTYMFANGESYVGDFKNDKFDGYGVFKRANGSVQKGQWVGDVFQEDLATTNNKGINKQYEKTKDEESEITTDDFNNDIKKVNSSSTKIIEKLNKNSDELKTVNDNLTNKTNSGEKGFAQSDEKCFPSGSSLIRAGINNDGNYIWLANVNNVTKIFDTREKTVVKVINDWKTDQPKYFPENKLKKQFQLIRNGVEERNNRNTLSGEVSVSHIFRIKDSLSNIVADFEIKGYISYYFDDFLGSLYIEDLDNAAYLIRPNEKVKKLKWKKFGRLIGEEQVSPKHSYLTDLYSCRVFNLITGKISAPLLSNPKSINENFGKATKAIVFSEDETEITIGEESLGLFTYNIETGNLLNTIPIPTDLPRIDGFKVIPSPNQTDFLYYLSFNNKWASGGLAYWVSDGKSTSFCDPLWAKESSENYSVLIEDALVTLQKKIEKDKEEEIKRAKNAYYPTTKEKQIVDKKTEYVKANCDICQGRGKVFESDGSIRRTYINSTYQQQSAGYSQVRCKACNGQGWKWEKR